jgi:hypothetical protein
MSGECNENGIPMIKDYIGDGVYAEYDGFGIWLHANEPDSEKAVYLEPVVLAALNRFAQRCSESKGKGIKQPWPTNEV